MAKKSGPRGHDSYEYYIRQEKRRLARIERRFFLRELAESFEYTPLTTCLLIVVFFFLVMTL